MSIRNKVLATVFIEDGCKQEDDEVSKHWRPINFDIYSELFVDLIYEGINSWLDDIKLRPDHLYELIMVHDVERDAGGAFLGESFHVESFEVQAL